MISPEIEAFLAAYTPEVRAVALRVRDLVLQVAPGLIEEVDVPAKLIGYSKDRTYKGTLCVIMPLKSAVNLGLARGADLPDPAGLLAGTGKRARHVKLARVEDVDDPALRALLEEARARLQAIPH